MSRLVFGIHTVVDWFEKLFRKNPAYGEHAHPPSPIMIVFGA
jgi:hypothetical protein